MALAKQGKLGFVHIIGYISTILVIIWTVLQIWSFVNNKTTPLEVTIRYKDNNYPTEFVSKLVDFENILFENDGILQQIPKCKHCDCQIKISDYVNKVREKFGPRLSAQLKNYGASYTLLIHNKSSSRCEHIKVYIPRTTLIKTYHNNSVIDSIENQDTVKIPEILPDDYISVVAWGFSRFYRLSAEEITVTSDSGNAKIRLLKDDIGLIGKFADKIFPDVRTFAVDFAGFILIVILIIVIGLIIESKKRIGSRKNTY
jgi:hypothetical protein